MMRLKLMRIVFSLKNDTLRKVLFFKVKNDKWWRQVGALRTIRFFSLFSFFFVLVFSIRRWKSFDKIEYNNFCVRGMDALIADARRFVHNQDHASARLLRELKLQSNVDEEMLVVVIGGVISVFLLVSEQPEVLANFLLVVTPLFFTYVFVDECPNVELLLLHWGCYGVSTLIDPTFKNIRGYFFFKVLFFLMLYLKPVLLSEKLLTAVRDFQKSQPSVSQLSLRTANAVTPSLDRNATEPAINDGTASLVSTSPARSPAFPIEDAMVNDPRHVLTPNTPGGGFAGDEMDPSQPQLPIAFNDLIFAPQEKLVFNGPLDEFTLTYYMSVESKAVRNIAFALKSNAIPRLTAIPPYGIIKPKEKQLIAVSVHKFDYFNEKDRANKDRIAFDYVFCGPEVTRFAHRLFQGQEMRRRKNIKINYNP